MGGRNGRARNRDRIAALVGAQPGEVVDEAVADDAGSDDDDLG